MSEIVLHSTNVNRNTCVPNMFIDSFMVEANGEYIKVFLYLLRHSCEENFSLSINSMSDALDHTQKDIKKALYYWESVGLLELTHDRSGEISGIYLNDSYDTVTATDSSVSTTINTTIEAVPPVISISPEPIIDSVSSSMISTLPAMPEIINIERLDADTSDGDLNSTMYMAEKLIGKTLTASEMQTIISWHDSLFLSWSLVEYIIESCVQKDIPRLSYMNQVAIGYAKEGIRTVEEAKLSGSKRSDIVYGIKAALGIQNRDLTSVELEYINRWTKTFGFSKEIILAACDKTVESIGNPSIKYINTILASWNEKNVTSLEEISLLDDAFKQEKQNSRLKASAPKRLPNFTERGTDYTSIEKRLVNK